MTDSLALYKETLNFAKKNHQIFVAIPTLKKFYLQLVTMVFYELTSKKNSPLVSALCQMYTIDFTPKNFELLPVQAEFDSETAFDLYSLIYGLDVAFKEDADSCLKVFDVNIKEIFRGNSLSEDGFKNLLVQLTTLDERLGKLHAEKIIEKRVDVAQGSDFSLKALIKSRQDKDEKIIAEVKKVQLSLQDELPQLEDALKKLSEIREELDARILEEPINQMTQLLDKLCETLKHHPQEDAQQGYKTLLEECGNFLHYLKQSLALLGAEIVDETNVPVDFNKHEVMNSIRPSGLIKVAKVLHVGLIYKGQILRKAEVEVE